MAGAWTRLVGAIADFASRAFAGESGLVTRERHRQMLGAAAEALSEAVGLAERQGVEGREELDRRAGAARDAGA